MRSFIMNRIHTLFIVASALVAHGAHAQDAPAEADTPAKPVPETPAPASAPELDAPAPTPAPAPAPEVKPAAPKPEAQPLAAEQPAAVASAPAKTPSSETLAERGGTFGIGLVIAPKVGGGLGSILLAGTGADLTASLELGYTLPLPQPIGRDIEVFGDVGYSGPSTQQTINANDPRLPSPSFHYTLTEHQLAVTWGALYRIPIGVDFIQPNAGLGLRTVWSDTIANADSGGKPFGTTEETAFDVGVDVRVGADFYVGPGSILAELGFSWVPANRFILQNTTTTALGLAVGYRFML
jgi:hypothetical protein